MNGVEVINLYKDVYDEGIELANHYKISFVNEWSKIKSIVTKEQFSQVEYKVESED